jgi:hypothetical protein
MRGCLHSDDATYPMHHGEKPSSYIRISRDEQKVVNLTMTIKLVHFTLGFKPFAQAELTLDQTRQKDGAPCRRRTSCSALFPRTVSHPMTCRAATTGSTPAECRQAGGKNALGRTPAHHHIADFIIHCSVQCSFLDGSAAIQSAPPCSHGCMSPCRFIFIK